VFPDDPFTQGLRRRTLASLHVNPNAASDWNPDVPLTISPQAAKTWQPPAPVQPPKPAPVKPDTSFNPNLDLQLGFQAGTGDLANMIYKPAEDLYGGRLASGKTLSQGVNQEVGPDPNQIASRTGDFQHAMQFAGRALPDVARYGLGTVAAAGDPVLGAFAADALKADTPGQAVASGLTSAAMTGLMHNVPSVIGEYGPQIVKDAASMLPSKAELQAAGEAANARLQASGMYSGARAPMGQMFDPGTIRDMAVSTGAQLGGGLYTVGEAAASRAKLVKNWITDLRNQELTPEEQDKFAQARQSSPELHEVGDLMMPLEARKVISSPQQVESVSRMLRVIPDSAKLAATAKMGVSKLGWYRGSSQALMDVFGEDAPRFAQLLAAMSPQTSVESNLQNALNTWKNWIAEGRPTGAGDIKRIMGASVQGGTEKSALDAWVNNSVSALSAEDPMKVTLSGPKVDSFYHNLRDDVFRVTNDAWMANAYGLAQDAFGGQGANVAAGNPGMTAQYGAASARLRDAALKAGMLPSQGQETIWSTAMQLYELAKEHGIHPREVLERNMLTPEIIRGAPDFSTLLKDPKYARILEESGYGPQLHAMKAFEFPMTSVPMSAAEQEQFGHVANILGETARIRGDVSQATRFAMPRKGVQPEMTPNASVQIEAQPGAGTRHFPETAALPYGSKAAYASGAMSPFENLRGQNVFMANPASGIQTVPSTGGIGAYTPASGVAETNPARSLGFNAPLEWRPRKGPRIEPDTLANVRGAIAPQTVMLAQEGAGIPAMIPHPDGKNISIRLPNKPTIRPEEMAALQQKYPDFAYAHAGSRLHVLNIKNLDMPDEMKNDMMQLVRGKSYENAHNAGDYLDFSDEWAQPEGQGAVTQKMMSAVGKMTPEARNAMDQDLRDTAGKTLAYYNQKVRTQGWTPRQDLMNLLGIMHQQGLAGVRKGLKNGAFLPGLVGGFLVPHLAQHGVSPDESTGPTQ
jgi:hypothetical protein